MVHSGERVMWHRASLDDWGSKGDIGLALKPPVAEVDGGERLDGRVGRRQLSSQCDDEIQVTKTHVCAWDPADCVVSHPRPDLEHAKSPTWRANYRCFEQAPASKFIFMRVRPGWCAKRHKIYTGSG